jgi:uncharacterized protein YggU (UPF0235/DUF167 family)
LSSSVDEFREIILRVINKNISESSDGVVITIRIEEDPRENYLTIEGDEIVFKTREARNENRCNSALIGVLSTTLKVPSSRIDIIYGGRGGSIKRVLIRDAKSEDIERKLLRALRPV